MSSLISVSGISNLITLVRQSRARVDRAGPVLLVLRTIQRSVSLRAAVQGTTAQARERAQSSEVLRSALRSWVVQSARRGGTISVSALRGTRESTVRLKLQV